MFGSFLALILLLSPLLPSCPFSRVTLFMNRPKVLWRERESDVVAFAYNLRLLEVQIRNPRKIWSR